MASGTTDGQLNFYCINDILRLNQTPPNDQDFKEKEILKPEMSAKISNFAVNSVTFNRKFQLLAMTTGERNQAYQVKSSESDSSSDKSQSLIYKFNP